MSVYIKGMDMPKSCFDCPFVDFEYGDCLVDENGHGDPNEPENCPLVPVPPHGRLIDADALAQNAYMLNEHYTYRRVYSADDVESAPTIIPR